MLLELPAQFLHNPDTNLAFQAKYRQHENVFAIDGAGLDDATRVCVLLQKLGALVCEKYTNYIHLFKRRYTTASRMPKRKDCSAQPTLSATYLKQGGYQRCGWTQSWTLSQARTQANRQQSTLELLLENSQAANDLSRRYPQVFAIVFERYNLSKATFQPKPGFPARNRSSILIDLCHVRLWQPLTRSCILWKQVAPSQR